jgi:ABC-type multidrug transport system fused ATPase/permease subunit
MLKQVLYKARGWCPFIYCLLFIEFLLQSLTPWLLGKALDELINGQVQNFILYIGCSVVGLIVGIIRRRIDTRVFSKITLKETLTYLSKKYKTVSTPSLIVRLSKIPLFIQFIEYTLPNILRSVIYIIVSIIFLSLTISYWVIIIIFLMSLTLFTSTFLTLKMEKIIHTTQEVEEAKIQNLTAGNLHETKKAYFTCQALDVKYSDLQAYNWGIVDVCCIGCEVVAVLVLVSLGSTPGSIIASLTYVYNLCGHFQIFPSILEQSKHLKVASTFLQKIN